MDISSLFKGPKIKILLVDDREDNLFSIKTVLERDEYHFCTANSGKQALKILLKEYDFTLILMDVEMPEINGFDTATLIYEREKLRHIPIIFITANNYSDEYVFRGYSSGAVDYIYKPINPQLLRAKVSVFVELYKKNHLLLAQERRLQQINIELEHRVRERTQELYQKNQELVNFNKELTKVNNDLDNFVYTASHDLKAPVSNIEGLLIALQDSLNSNELDRSEVDAMLEMMSKSVIQFKNTIKDIADISRIQKDLEEDIIQVNLSTIFKEVLLSINDMVEKSFTQINIDIEENLQVRYSAKNLRSIFLNLLTNAIKYRSEQRPSKIEIIAKSNSENVIISFKDNGIGMNEADIPKIFRMFKRLNTDVEGSGVGLYIVKRILDNSGDSIEVKSEIDKGSVFKVFIKK